MEHNFIENELIIITKETLDKFLQSGNYADLIALYTFYYYTAKWQKTNQIKSTTEYTAKGINWCVDKVRKIKKLLIDFGLIEDLSVKNEKGQVTGHYIKMNYIFKKTTEDEIKNHTSEKPECGSIHSVENSTPNTLNTNNKNTLSTNKINYNNIVDYLNLKAKTNYRSTTPKTQTLIKSRINEGFTEDDFKKVIDNMCSKWLGTDMAQYLRPETLFGNKFEGYLNIKITSSGKQANKTTYEKSEYDNMFDDINNIEI
jgi:uncharacterized phage protein (TIGR02220 family)